MALRNRLSTRASDEPAHSDIGLPDASMHIEQVRKRPLAPRQQGLEIRHEVSHETGELAAVDGKDTMQFPRSQIRSRPAAVFLICATTFAASTLTLSGFAIPSARAQSVAEFYPGKTVIIYVGYAP